MLCPAKDSTPRTKDIRVTSEARHEQLTAQGTALEISVPAEFKYITEVIVSSTVDSPGCRESPQLA
jgi:hypothetical protein